MSDWSVCKSCGTGLLYTSSTGLCRECGGCGEEPPPEEEQWFMMTDAVGAITIVTVAIFLGFAIGWLVFG